VSDKSVFEECNVHVEGVCVPPMKEKHWVVYLFSRHFDDYDDAKHLEKELNEYLDERGRK